MTKTKANPKPKTKTINREIVTDIEIILGEKKTKKRDSRKHRRTRKKLEYSKKLVIKFREGVFDLPVNDII